jgi:hypothetical protein
MIQLYGITDNYNTEYTEWLHIDLAKNAYRAMNHKDEYMQMTLWLERREKMLWHDKFIHWHHFGSNLPIHSLPYFPAPSDLVYHRQHKIAKHLSARRMSFETLANEYGAPYFQAVLARFIAEVNQLALTVRQLEDAACGMIIPFRAVAVFHKVHYNTVCNNGIPNTVTVDSIHVRPQRCDRHKR